MKDADCEELLAEIRQCRLCAAHLQEGPRPVLQMHPRARILIAGQAPGRRVHASGVPFDDASGNRLRDWMGISREIFYNPEQVAVLPMGFCYPGKGRAGDLPPRPECAPAWRERLLAMLPSRQLTLVIGAYAHRWHLPAARGGVTEVVGDWRAYWPEIVPLPHPSPRNQHWLKNNPWFVQTLLPSLRARVREIVHAG